MNKTIFKWAMSVSALSFVLLAYQNCSESGFSASSKVSSFGSASILGGLTSMDDQGNVDGQVSFPNCSGDDCPGQLSLDISVIGDNGQAIPVGTSVTSSNPQNEANVYVIDIKVPVAHQCKDVIVVGTNQETSEEFQIPYSGGFAPWGGISACGGNFTPLVQIDNGKTDGPFVQITGQCLSGTSLVPVGSVSGGFDDSIECHNGTFQYCTMLDGAGSINVTLQQILNNITAQDTMNYTVNVPGLLTFEVTDINVVNLNATVQVKCTPGAKVEFVIYSSSQKKMDCGDDGMITYVVKLIKTSKRTLSVIQTTAFGVTKTISIDVDAKGLTPSCAINHTAGDNFCSDRSGSISGTCQAGWPVFAKVDGALQNVVICTPQGTFTMDRLILSDDNSGSNVMIEQVNPLDQSKKCSDSKNMMSF